MAERVVDRDIDVALVGKDACLNLPVGEAGVEQKENILVHRLEHL